jgi:nitroimidazol reductase NimA-like FMN-containing flavoprotein (pyridoxamine 5'-phosphate oxidase superfamily)
MIDQILDEGLVCHVGIVEDGQTVIIPMAYVRIGDQIVVHGSRASRLLRTLAHGVEACIAVTLLDGLVLARSAFHHSMNYRSVVLFGTGTAIEDLQEKLEALRLLTERLTPGRWPTIRTPTERELQQTLVVAVSIREASAKIRTGPPLDDEEDCTLPIWAGVLPLRLASSKPIPDPGMKADIPIPQHVAHWQERGAR